MDKQISLKNMEGQPKNLTLKIPQGIRDGEKIRLIGQGKPGRDGGKSGDLLIKVKVKDDNKFKLKGCDLYTDLLFDTLGSCFRNKSNSTIN